MLQVPSWQLFYDMTFYSILYVPILSFLVRLVVIEMYTPVLLKAAMILSTLASLELENLLTRNTPVTRCVDAVHRVVSALPEVSHWNVYSSKLQRFNRQRASSFKPPGPTASGPFQDEERLDVGYYASASTARKTTACCPCAPAACKLPRTACIPPSRPLHPGPRAGHRSRARAQRDRVDPPGPPHRNRAGRSARNPAIGMDTRGGAPPPAICPPQSALFPVVPSSKNLHRAAPLA